eukprot:352589-Chlamydomonas_euryale.AAC.3
MALSLTHAAPCPCTSHPCTDAFSEAPEPTWKIDHALFVCRPQTSNQTRTQLAPQSPAALEALTRLTLHDIGSAQHCAAATPCVVPRARPLLLRCYRSCCPLER